MKAPGCPQAHLFIACPSYHCRVAMYAPAPAWTTPAASPAGPGALAGPRPACPLNRPLLPGLANLGNAKPGASFQGFFSLLYATGFHGFLSSPHA